MLPVTTRWEASMTTPEPLLIVNDLSLHYPLRGGILQTKQGSIKAVNGVSFTIYKGETLGLVGESGCGKSTLGRTLMRLETPTTGNVLMDGVDLAHLSRRELFHKRRDLQMIFQNPFGSLNPRMTVGEIVQEPLVIHKLGTRQEQERKVVELLEKVGLSDQILNRYPHEFSGGQRQRIGIARALTLNPRLIIADEPVSALDVSVQAQVLNILVDLQKELSLTYLFISHDLSVVEYISDRVAIMYLGKLVEIGPTKSIFAKPSHPYTRALIESVPKPDPRNRLQSEPLKGEPPSPAFPPPGCAFHPRCPFATEECRKEVPALEKITGSDTSHVAACIHKDELPEFQR